MTEQDYELWRPALAAFYRAECAFQSADNLTLHQMPLNLDDKRCIRALQAAFIVQAVNHKEAA